MKNFNRHNNTSFLSTLQQERLKKIKKYRGFGQKIAQYILSLRTIKNLSVSNKRIATHFKCSIRTVQRWTAQFVFDGWLIKRHRDYELNHYTVSISKAQSYALWLNSIPNPTAFIAHGIIPKENGNHFFQHETVIPSSNYIYIKTTPVVLSAHARGSSGLFSKKERNRSICLASKRLLVNEEAKKLLKEHKEMPGIRNVFESSSVQSELFTESIRKLERILGLSVKERLKLVAYPDEVVDYVASIVEGMNGRSMQVEIKDVMGWLMALLKKHCGKKVPDWGWYYDVCRILNEPPVDFKEGRSVVLGTGKKRWEPKAASDVNPEYKKIWQAPVQGDRVSYLTSELVLLREQEKNPEKYFPSFLMDVSVRRVRNTIESHEKELLTLESGNGKEVYNTWQSGTMGTGGTATETYVG
jgi:hypothetical protein